MMRLLSLVMLLNLVACSWLTDGESGYFRDRGGDYKLARVEPGIKLPPGLGDDALQDIYVIPPITEQLVPAGEFEVPRPAPLVAGEDEELVRIQKLGDEQWMLVAVAPGQLWPQVRAFITSSGVRIGRVDARAGIIETGWLEREDGAMQERYRFRIEQGVQRNTSELHVLHMAMAGATDSWPVASQNRQHEGDMLLAVAQYIANNTETAPVSMMAQQAISAGGKVSMREFVQGEPYIRLELPYYRAWASVERALGESSFEVRDRDRSAGVYYIRYAEPDADGGGWFDWLFPEDDGATAESIVGRDFLLQIAALPDEDMVHITIRREDGVAMDVSQSQSLLTLVKANIN